MEQQAKGEFEVKRSVEPSCDMGDDVMAGHFRFDKRFQGDLDASSVVHMLAIATDVAGSAAYVAIERLSGTLRGSTSNTDSAFGRTSASVPVWPPLSRNENTRRLSSHLAVTS